VFEISNVEIEQTFLNPEYDLSQQPVANISITGWLVIFNVTPKSRSGPCFVGRWDGGSRDARKTERYDLDIDINGISKAQQLLFKRGESGYSGHHAKKIPSDRGLDG
jgi:hypothetical protein